MGGAREDDGQTTRTIATPIRPRWSPPSRPSPKATSSCNCIDEATEARQPRLRPKASAESRHAVGPRSAVRHAARAHAGRLGLPSSPPLGQRRAVWQALSKRAARRRCRRHRLADLSGHASARVGRRRPPRTATTACELAANFATSEILKEINLRFDILTSSPRTMTSHD